MQVNQDFHQLRAMLEWQIDCGATEAICDAPIDRFEHASAPDSKPAPSEPAQANAPGAQIDPVQEARAAASSAPDLGALRHALERFPHCELQRGARNLVFSDGNPEARVMIVGEAPGRDEDIEGRPFVGRAGKMLDRMFEAIGLSRVAQDAENALYITNVSPWRPPQNRDPSPTEIAMLRPFIERHIALINPDVLVLMGNISCLALLGEKGITRLRGKWAETQGRPALPMFHPAYLLRDPEKKREAWHDLLMLQAKLRER